jgi:hypothetical protein
MSATPSRKLLSAASAAALSAMSFLMGAGPVSASPMLPLDPPGGCDSYTFPAGFTIKQSDGTVITVNNGVVAQFNGVHATYNTGGQTTTGTVSGGSVGGVNLDFSIAWNAGPGAGATTHYTGVVSKAGNGQGSTTSTKGPSLTWSSMPQTLGCVMNNPAPAQQQQQPAPVNNPVPAPPPAPSIDVAVNQGNPDIVFTVHNTSAEDLKCVYNAKKLSGMIGPPTTTRDFSLKAGAQTTLSFVEIPVGTTYQVDISCQGSNGGTTWSHNFTG